MAGKTTPSARHAAATTHASYPNHPGAEYARAYGGMQSMYAQVLNAGMSGMLEQQTLSNMMQPGTTMPTQLFPGGPYTIHNGQMILAGYPGIPGGVAAGPVHEGTYAAYHAAPYIHGGYPAYVRYPMLTPGRAERHLKDVPGLDKRRGSYSTTESSPATPFYGSAPRVAVVDRSTYTTPSPQQITASGIINPAAPKAPAVIAIPVDKNLDEVLKQAPEIPRAVPAIFTPPHQRKTLEQSLENRIPGNRNVYIRGLHPTTDDDLLLRYASRFGKVETSKAIIDTSTGACKGFGFAKFVDVRHSEMCICGFYRLGYEVGFARESFNSRLKAEGDGTSTNLYISNLPKSVDETALETVFRGYPILSSKILRDSMGNSRGVGFARFETRDVCDEIIRKYNGIQQLGDERLVMQIRYADNPAQKELKRVTAERRQFRTNEYNISAYGTAVVGIHPSIYQKHSAWNKSQDPGHSYTARTSPAPASSTREMSIPDISGLTISNDDSTEEDSPKSSTSSTSVVANGSIYSSPSVKKEKN